MQLSFRKRHERDFAVQVLTEAGLERLFPMPIGHLTMRILLQRSGPITSWQLRQWCKKPLCRSGPDDVKSMTRHVYVGSILSVGFCLFSLSLLPPFSVVHLLLP